MAANHTKNYQLNLWEPSDTFLRAEFNADNEKLDAALAQKANASALNSLVQTVAGKGNCSIVTGSYTGTGEYGEEHPCVLDFAQSVGKPPLLLYVAPEGGGSSMMLACRGQKASYPFLLDHYWGYGLVQLTWTGTGVIWYQSHNAQYQLNIENTVYRYAVLF